MIYLLSASFIWAFSFGLIKNNLAGLDPLFISTARLFLSAILFFPLLFKYRIITKLKFRLILTGAVQYGLMYIFYIFSYKYLQSYEVALFTIFTPLYISIIYSVRERSVDKILFLLSFVSIIAAAIILYSGINSSDSLKGFFILQLSNICFAWGQLEYRNIMRNNSELKDQNVFGYLYIGGFLISFVSFLIFTDKNSLVLNTQNIITLLYLGIIASGIGFFLWNYGVKKSRVVTLSIFNNAKIPLAIFVSLIIFREKGNIFRLLFGGLLLSASIYFGEKKNNLN